MAIDKEAKFSHFHDYRRREGGGVVLLNLQHDAIYNSTSAANLLIKK